MSYKHTHNIAIHAFRADILKSDIISDPKCHLSDLCKQYCRVLKALLKAILCELINIPDVLTKTLYFPVSTFSATYFLQFMHNLGLKKSINNCVYMKHFELAAMWMINYAARVYVCTHAQ